MPPSPVEEIRPTIMDSNSINFYKILNTFVKYYTNLSLISDIKGIMKNIKITKYNFQMPEFSQRKHC